jgi:aminoglycoside phosphotransferase (APT) family kinase protein
MSSLARWLQRQLGADRPPVLRLHGGPTSAGFSSDTLLFSIADEPRAGEYVLRMPPPADAFPIFPTYDLERQVSAMRLVGNRTTVPVPHIPWFEPDPVPLGAPFFIMERLDGVAAADMPPYVLEGWLLDAGPSERARAEAGIVRVLAGVHDLTVSPDELTRFAFDEPGDSPLRQHVARERRYYDWVRAGERFPLIEALFAWLEASWPEQEGPTVLGWGDARVANVLFRDCEPTAILDWEVAALGPRELDLAWLVFFHGYFQRIATRLGREGLPDFLQLDTVVAAYTALAGYEPQDLDWYLAYAALRQALVSIRVTTRAVHFGEREPPDDPSELIMDRAHLEGIVSQ